MTYSKIMLTGTKGPDRCWSFGYSGLLEGTYTDLSSYK